MRQNFEMILNRAGKLINLESSSSFKNTKNENVQNQKINLAKQNTPLLNPS